MAAAGARIILAVVLSDTEESFKHVCEDIDEEVDEYKFNGLVT